MFSIYSTKNLAGNSGDGGKGGDCSPCGNGVIILTSVVVVVEVLAMLFTMRPLQLDGVQQNSK